MPPDVLAVPRLSESAWLETMHDLEQSRRELGAAPAGIFRQSRYDRLLAVQRQATDLIHGWLSAAFAMEPVQSPRLVFSLDVDGVLEDDGNGFSSTSVAGAAALKLLQLGRVAVLLNTARCMDDVRERADRFHLLGGVSAFGSVAWDGVFDREMLLVSLRAQDQLAALRSALRSDPGVVLDPAHETSLRVSRIVDGAAMPLVGPDARRLLDRLELANLTFWVAPGHTDFVDRSVDKGASIERLCEMLGLASLPLAAMGDASCDLPMLRRARFAFVPVATLPAYAPPRGQKLTRARGLGAQALWEAACQLVPDADLQREVLARIERVDVPDWLPDRVGRPPITARRFFPRITAALTTIRRTD